MARDRAFLSLCAAALAMAAGARTAGAGSAARRSHVVEDGESLWKIARAYRCEVDEIRRANRLDSDVIRAGQRLRIPACTAGTASADGTAGRDPDALGETDAADPDEDENEDADRPHAELGGAIDDGRGAADTGRAIDDARRAADTGRGMDDAREAADAGRAIDDARRAAKTIVDSTAVDHDLVPYAVPLTGQSFGRPQHGYLVSGKHMPPNPAAYYLRRPERAWAANHTIAQLVRAIYLVRRRYPRVHALAIGDLSKRHGGPLTMHGSHQSGRDADVGFYFRSRPRGYPRGFAIASADNLDFPATWALLSALCGTAESPLGVERIYMTYSTQALFYRLARKYRVRAALLEKWFQYPHGRRANHGIIRHEPGHEDHVHVRFRCAPTDLECQ